MSARRRAEEGVRRVLQRLYDEAKEAGLEPTWHEDYSGISYKCPCCEGAGRVVLDVGQLKRELGVEHRLDPPVP